MARLSLPRIPEVDAELLVWLESREPLVTRVLPPRRPEMSPLETGVDTSLREPLRVVMEACDRDFERLLFP